MAERWCLVLALWGDKYGAAYVNLLVSSARDQSPGLGDVVLLTDRIRDDIDPSVQQKLFAPFFRKEAFFRGGYQVKLSVFDRDSLPRGCRCVFLDLDSIVMGDVGRIAALVQNKGDYWMLPPGNVVGFGPLRRRVARMSQGRYFAAGNSSVLAFHSDAAPNLAETFQRLYEGGDTTSRHMKVDDLFISWFAQQRIRAIPKTLAVMFRREYLARTRLLLLLALLRPDVRRRRAGIVVMTLNGETYKPAVFLNYAEGALIRDPRGRVGYWSQRWLGPAKARIEAFSRAVTGAGPR